MKERIRNLGRFQKTVLIIVTVMAVLFTVLYARAAKEKGFRYLNGYLTRSEEGGSTVYSGTLQGRPAAFTVTNEKESVTLTFTHADKTFGPYTVTEDPKAVPEGIPGQVLTGYEIRLRDRILFRGGARCYPDSHYWELFKENGSPLTLSGVVIGHSSGSFEPVEPDIRTILDVATGPELEHKGYFGLWFLGIVICIVTALSILFADELFRFNMSLRMKDAYMAEPSELELAGRYISWAVLPIAALAVFWLGLR